MQLTGSCSCSSGVQWNSTSVHFALIKTLFAFFPSWLSSAVWKEGGSPTSCLCFLFYLVSNKIRSQVSNPLIRVPTLASQTQSASPFSMSCQSICFPRRVMSSRFLPAAPKHELSASCDSVSSSCALLLLIAHFNWTLRWSGINERTCVCVSLRGMVCVLGGGGSEAADMNQAHDVSAACFSSYIVPKLPLDSLFHITSHAGSQKIVKSRVQGAVFSWPPPLVSHTGADLAPELSLFLKGEMWFYQTRWKHSERRHFFPPFFFSFFNMEKF